MNPLRVSMDTGVAIVFAKKKECAMFPLDSVTMILSCESASRMQISVTLWAGGPKILFDKLDVVRRKKDKICAVESVHDQD